MKAFALYFLNINNSVYRFILKLQNKNNINKLIFSICLFKFHLLFGTVFVIRHRQIMQNERRSESRRDMNCLFP